MKKVLAFGLAGGLLASSLGLAGMVEANVATEVASQEIQQQSKEMTQILEINKQLAEIDMNKDLKSSTAFSDLMQELAYVENNFDYIDDKTGLGFFYNAETGEYVNKLLTIKIDVNTDKIYNMETGEELTSYEDINSLLFVHQTYIDVHINVDAREDKFFDLLWAEKGEIPNVIVDNGSN
ncbi:hypothetical protein [Bacillus solimangrovi]|uniref:Uncharacterized protein n=1 Tax=Bacillus solimangrovi TaxID=1305675 RepID=A0A1E5LIU5_9BACI|nr:hypothetical protein [Bacillus solimangrovi]OEH94009.1 hypothetical protein BFG57_10205 [Bacillus solimangrovi]